MKNLKNLLPDFPRTPHTPYAPNMSVGDFVAKEEDMKVLFETTNLYIHIEEKIDGASCGIALVDGNPVIRNRNHILQKGFVKDTAAKKQFASIWGWFYDNKAKFEMLEELRPGVSVYGEWMWALHGISYDRLPSYFFAYDLYDWHDKKFVATQITRELLIKCGFTTPPLLHKGVICSPDALIALCNKPSAFSSTDDREGIYVRMSDQRHLLHRYKMVRQGYIQGARWDAKRLTRNKLTS